MGKFQKVPGFLRKISERCRTGIKSVLGKSLERCQQSNGKVSARCRKVLQKSFESQKRKGAGQILETSWVPDTSSRGPERSLNCPRKDIEPLWKSSGKVGEKSQQVWRKRIPRKVPGRSQKGPASCFQFDKKKYIVNFI